MSSLDIYPSGFATLLVLGLDLILHFFQFFPQAAGLSLLNLCRRLQHLLGVLKMMLDSIGGLQLELLETLLGSIVQFCQLCVVGCPLLS